MRESMLENQLWHMIRQAAANDPALMEMLKQVKAFYLLKYGGKDDNSGQKIFPGGGTISSYTG